LVSRSIVRQAAIFISGIEEKNLVVTVPNHPELAKGTLISIMKQARLERKGFISALKK